MEPFFLKPYCQVLSGKLCPLRFVAKSFVQAYKEFFTLFLSWGAACESLGYLAQAVCSHVIPTFGLKDRQLSQAMLIKESRDELSQSFGGLPA